MMIKYSIKEDRAAILKGIGLKLTMSQEQGLAMKADLNMTWYTFRAWGR